MLKPRKKLIIGILLTMLILSAIFFTLVVYGAAEIGFFSTLDSESDQLSRSESQLQGILDTFDMLEWNLSEVYDNYYAQIQNKADLTAYALRQRVKEDGDRSISTIGDGGVIKIENGTTLIPQGFRTGVDAYADRITGEKGRLIYDTKTVKGDRKDLLVYSRIDGSYYYVEIINGNEFLSYIDKNADYLDMLEGIEEAYNMSIFLICPDPGKSRYFFNQPGNLVYSTDVFYEAKIDSLNRTTINAEDLKLPSDRNELLNLDGMIITGEEKESNKSYRYLVREIEHLDSILVLKTETTMMVGGIADQVTAGLTVMLIIAVIFLIWITSVYDVVSNGILTEDKKKKYSPARVRLVALSYGILSTILIFGFCVYVRALSNIYQEIEESTSILNVLNFKLDSMDENEKNLDRARKNLYLDYGVRAAQMIDKNPRLINREDLAEINSIIGSKFLILFDSEGKEISSSGDYINMELGDENAEHPTSTADFRKILHGVPGIAHGTVRDEVIGEELDMVGVRTNDKESGQYGVLLLAFDPQNKEVQRNVAIQDIMQALIPGGEICFAVDPDTKKVTYATESNYIFPNMTISQVGLTESMLGINASDFISVAGVKFFCVSNLDADDHVVRYIMSPNDRLMGNSFRYGMVYAISFAILFLILCLYLLPAYSEKKLLEIDAAQAGGEQGKEKAKKEKTGLFKGLEQLTATIAHRLNINTPRKKALFALKFCVALLIINTIRLMLINRDWRQQNVLITYILEGKWNKGLNLFALTAIFLLAVSIFMCLMIVRFIIRTIGRMLNPRGQTICQLVSNMFGYMGMLVFVYYALSYIGVDTNAILASVGVLGIGVSMGATDLIADILAGVSTIFEGEYQVGDIVNINGYRGMVEDIGVRSTRVVGRGGNERIFSNKDINNVINLTKMNSWVAITIRVDVTYPLQDVEAILTQKLPEIGENCKYIINGPIYKGVLSIEAGFAVLSIIAECNEDNYHKVERTLNREVLIALREKNVPVK